MAEFAKRLYSAARRLYSRLLFRVRVGSIDEMKRPDPWDKAYLLEPDEKGDKDQDIKFLRLQLTKLRADNTELQNRPNEWRTEFEKLFSMTEVQIQEIASQYNIWEDIGVDGKSHWIVDVERCIFCGDPLDAAVFHARRDALLYAALLQTVGYRPRHNRCCSSCYAQHEETNEISIT